MTESTLLSAREVARRLGVDVRTVQRKAATGEIQSAHKMSGDTGAYLFAPETVDELVKAAS